MKNIEKIAKALESIAVSFHKYIKLKERKEEREHGIAASEKAKKEYEKEFPGQSTFPSQSY